MNKKINISILALFIIIISVTVTTIFMNNDHQSVDSNPNLATSNAESRTKMDKIYININDQKLEIELEDNLTTAALLELLPLDIVMNDLNNNEKYVYLDESLPTNAYNPKRVEAGDVMLFDDNCLVIFYESFDTNYSYSRIGHINNLPKFGTDSISVSLSID